MMQPVKLILSERIQKVDHQDFFKGVLTKFAEELGALCKEMYMGKESEMFSLIERTYIGILNNAIVRLYDDRVTTLQEFSVWDTEKIVGRADFLVKMNFKDHKTYFLFEGKHREFIGKIYSGSNLENDYNDFIFQALKYYNAEKKYYEEPVFIVAIIFEWIRNQHRLDQVLNWPDEDDGLTDFYMLLRSYNVANDNSGLMVYGKVVDPTNL
jgi:hypothetical protein